MDAITEDPPLQKAGSSQLSAVHVLLLLGFINFVNQIDRRGLSTVFPLLQAEWGLSDAQLGLAVSLFTLARSAISVPAGWLADRIGILRVLRPLAFIWSGMVVLSGWANGFSSFLVMRLGVGLADGANGPLDLALLGKVSPKNRRGLFLSIYSVALYAGTAIGIVLAGAVGERYGWRWVFLGPGLLGLLAAFGFLFLRQDPSPVATSKWDPIAQLKTLNFKGLFRGPLPGIFLGGAMGVFASTALVSWLPTYLVRQFELSLTRAGLLTGGLILPASALGTILGGWLSDRLSQRLLSARYWVSISGLLLAAVLGLVGLSSTELPSTMIGFFCSAVFFTLPVSPLLILVQDSVRKNRLATTQAVFGLTTQVLGAAPATFSIGLLSDQIGLRMALILPFIAAALGALIIAISRKVETAEKPIE